MSRAADNVMDHVYRPPNILRLTGVTLADYVSVEDMADSVLLDQGGAGAALGPDDPPPEDDCPPDKIPRVFTGLDDWPHSTNLRCWVCDFTFDDRPKFVPTYVREAESGGIEFGVLGNMCTFNCAELWIETHLGGRASNEERWRSQDNLCLVYFLFTGRRVSRLKPAPRKTEMRKYGGDWDEDTFWRKLRELDPVAGLRDHTPGSVVPERDRTRSALSGLRARPGAALAFHAPPGALLGASPDAPPGPPRLVAAPKAGSVWGVCGKPVLAPPAPAPASAPAPDPEPPRAAPKAGPAPPADARGDNVAAPCLGDGDLESFLAEKLGPPDAAPPPSAAPIVITGADLDELLAGFGDV